VENRSDPTAPVERWRIGRSEALLQHKKSSIAQARRRDAGTVVGRPARTGPVAPSATVGALGRTRWVSRGASGWMSQSAYIDSGNPVRRTDP